MCFACDTNLGTEHVLCFEVLVPPAAMELTVGQDGTLEVIHSQVTLLAQRSYRSAHRPFPSYMLTLLWKVSYMKLYPGRSLGAFAEPTSPEAHT